MSTLASVILRDVFANRPSAGIVGRLFYATDTSQLYRDNGASWDTYSGTGGGGGITFSDAEVPTGTINGTNTAFTLAHSPTPAKSLMLVLNGLVQNQQVSGGDYALSGTGATFTSAPPTGSTLLAWYRY